MQLFYLQYRTALLIGTIPVGGSSVGLSRQVDRHDSWFENGVNGSQIFNDDTVLLYIYFYVGSSLLPPGGWAELSPLLQISWGGAAQACRN